MSIDLLLPKWTTEFKKGYSKPLILFALSIVGKSYPYILTKEILKLTQGEISIAGSNIYPMLSKLEDDELIAHQKDESDRKFYFLTQKGKDFLQSLEAEIQKFNSIMLEIINPNQYHGDV